MPTNPHHGPSRRRFLQQFSIAGLAAGVPRSLLSERLSSAAKINPSLSAPVKNRTPLAVGSYYPLPLGSIRPRGWLKDQLQIQARGLGGHLDETWADVGPNSGWLGGTGESWERGPYFLDGLVPLAYLLDDERLKTKAQKYLDWTLESQQPNGMFGPRSNDDWWPRMVMLKALTQYHEATGDSRVLPLMRRYFAYQLQSLPKRPLRDWGKFRWQDQVLSVLWLFNRTGDPKLLELAKLLHAQGFDWQGQYTNFQYTRRITPEFINLAGNGLNDRALATHGVNNGMAIKASPVWSLVSGSNDDRTAVLRMLAELDRYHGLPNGMFSCDEHFAGLNPSQGSELCTVVEAMFSLEQSLAITGEASLGDRLERIAFNALPGTFTDDMWAHQYNQEPNQVECSLHHQPWTTDGPESNLFGLEPNFGCCTANFHQGWPKFAASLWMLSHDDGLVATAYSPCEVRTIVRDTPVRIVEETEYPFRGVVRIFIDPTSPVAFPLALRIPVWAQGCNLKVNGEPQPSPSPGSFYRIERRWSAGSHVEIVFAMEPRASTWNRGAVTFERGPLVFSYSIGEDWLKLRDRGMTADWQVYPTTPWNYALSIPAAQPAAVAETPLGEAVFTRRGAPIKLRVKARRLPTWLAEDGVAQDVPQSPVKSSEPEVTIELIPYAAAKLRITAFPRLEG